MSNPVKKIVSKARVATKPYSDGIRDGRAILVTEKNAHDVHNWIGEKSVLTYGDLKNLKKPKLKIKTEKGFRVALVGDTILKFGKGADSTYLVVKAS